MAVVGERLRAERPRERVRRHRWARVLLWVTLFLLALAILIRVLLDPIVARVLHQKLQQIPEVRGNFEHVHVSILPPGVTLTRLKLVPNTPPGDDQEPLVYVERVWSGLDWHQLLRMRLVARTRIDDPKLAIINTGPKAPSEPKEPAKSLAQQLADLMPGRLDRLEVRRGEVLFRDLTQPNHPEVWLHKIEVAAENLATRSKLASGFPATVTASATLGRSGDISLFVSADPFEKMPAFAGRMQMRGYQVAELYDFIAPKAKMQATKGTLDVFAAFRSEKGLISGGVEPVLKNVELEATEGGIWNRLKAWLADATLDLFSDRVPGRNAVATVIPIKGRLDKPDVQIWPTVLGVVRNAFVEGISGGFAHVPPPTADKKESAFKQAKDALKKGEGVPEAQPAKTPDKDKDKDKPKEEKKK